MTDMGYEFRDDAEHDPYADGTYGKNDTPASTSLEEDKHEMFSHQQSVVMALARGARYHGITGYDVTMATGWNDSPKSRAMSNLLREGALVRLRERRDRGHIHVLPEWVAGREVLPYESQTTRNRIEVLREALAAVSEADSKWDAIEAIDRLIAREMDRA